MLREELDVKCSQVVDLQRDTTDMIAFVRGAFDSRSCTVAVFPKRLNCSSAVTFEFSERFSCFSFKRKCMGHRRNYLGRPIITNVDKSSAVAGMGNRLATIDMGHKERD